jgi:hypothetical protein
MYMKGTISTLAQLNQRAKEILIQEMGVIDAIRFLAQYSNGSGDYTTDRKQWIDGLSLDDISSEIRSRRRTTPRSKE